MDDMTHSAENDVTSRFHSPDLADSIADHALDKSLGRRALDCACCSAVDDVALDDLIAEVLHLRTRPISPGTNA